VLFPTEERPVPPSAEHIWEHLVQHVQGTPVPITDENISRFTDWPKVRKYYKLNGVPAVDGLADEKDKFKEMELLAISSMALRGL
jgi:EKC/KEOPS complex subunit CGI121/TPRKB